ncbi:MAG TPA: DUF4038 domain-containing protein [Tepidisphaeraceae bacterium]|jgi:hypothetical protein|nr:DUF4038 domain-containing protein [Tepidisphaeraceae bacterium]
MTERRESAIVERPNLNSSLATEAAEAPLRGAYEVTLTASPVFTDAFLQNDLRVTFTRSNGTRVSVNGFYDGGTTFKARVYLDVVGDWSWRSSSSDAGLNAKSGTFTVVNRGNLPGKLRKSTRDPRQFVHDDGAWFLHLGDTGYRYINGTEANWQQYIDQAAETGFTKVRTWFGTPGDSGHGNSNGNIAYMFTTTGLNLAELRTADARLIYALDRHPSMQVQLIPFGEDTGKLLAYADPSSPEHALVRAYTREVHARYGALPNVQWCLSNDRGLKDNAELRRAVDALGTDWAVAERFGTLLTNHQARRETYAFTDASWSDIVTFEHVDQVQGKQISKYRSGGATGPIVNDEDRYESYIPPEHVRYFFRRLMWASLLSGGVATYGGGETWKPYAADTLGGIQGYNDLKRAGLLTGGADDFKHVHRFFKETGLDLVGLTPCDELVGDNPAKVKAIRGDDVLIIYLANPTGDAPQTDDAAATTPSVTIDNAVNFDNWFASWFDPRAGNWASMGQVTNAHRTFAAPAGGDWLLLLRRKAVRRDGK